MSRNRILPIILFLGISFYSCNNKNADIPDESYVAFSLRQAQQLLKQNNPEFDSAVYNLGGITRLVGMVIDKKNNDIIVVGKKSSQLPTARFDDFVTALRARFVYDELPMVSIDPTPKSVITGKQEVRFGGHIEGTSFGQDFLNSDILLKKYSLELAQQVNSVPSYKKLMAADEIDNLKQQGIKITGLNWISADSLNKISRRSQGSGQTTQSRFWYNYKDPYTVRIRGNVFCIMALDITIEDEIYVNSVLQKNDSSLTKKVTPGVQFSNLFADNFYKISNTHPVIKRLKLLFDMTALAESLKNTKDIPDISFLLKDYQVKKINTLKAYDFIKMGAVITRGDGRKNLIELSGGVGPSVDLQWLNAGDVGYLEKFVLQSRPDENSLFWRIPVDSWDMPNSNGIVVKKRIENKSENSGCTFYSRTLPIRDIPVNQLTISRPSGTDFIGFPKVPYLAPVQTKGVQMRMKIDTSSFRHIDSLRKIRELILNNHS